MRTVPPPVRGHRSIETAREREEVLAVRDARRRANTELGLRAVRTLVCVVIAVAYLT